MFSFHLSHDSAVFRLFSEVPQPFLKPKLSSTFGLPQRPTAFTVRCCICLLMSVSVWGWGMSYSVLSSMTQHLLLGTRQISMDIYWMDDCNAFYHFSMASNAIFLSLKQFEALILRSKDLPTRMSPGEINANFMQIQVQVSKLY